MSVKQHALKAIKKSPSRIAMMMQTGTMNGDQK
jgi:hypothetical protein